MFNTDILYKKNSFPLEKVEKVELDEIYYTEEGYGIKFIDNNELVFMQSSPLVFGEKIGNLSDKQLHLFWVLVKNTEPMNK